MKYKILTLLISLILFSGCAIPTHRGYQQRLDLYLTKTSKDILRQFGIPDQDIKSPNSYNRLWVYHHSYSYTTKSKSNTTLKYNQWSNKYESDTDYTPSKTKTSSCETIFEINAKGLVVDAFGNGSACKAKELYK